MAITTDDCKKLLLSDTLLLASGASDPKTWKRLSKRNGAAGVERIFSHGSGMMAKVIESGGAIEIAAIGKTPESLEDPQNQRTLTHSSPSASASLVGAEAMDEESANTSSYWTKMASGFEASKARRVVDLMLGRFDEDHERDFWKMAERVNPIALANQFIFALTSEDESIVIISPLKYFETDGVCYDQESPIGHLLPDDSDDLNGCGTWQIPTDLTPTELAVDLMARGFVWNKAFQDFIDADAMSFMTPILEQRELEKTTPKAAKRSSSNHSI